MTINLRFAVSERGLACKCDLRNGKIDIEPHVLVRIGVTRLLLKGHVDQFAVGNRGFQRLDCQAAVGVVNGHGALQASEFSGLFCIVPLEKTRSLDIEFALQRNPAELQQVGDIACNIQCACIRRSVQDMDSQHFKPAFGISCNAAH